jgi:hypothetical protein
MITIYLDHSVIDGFDKGKTAYLDPLLADKGVLPIISISMLAAEIEHCSAKLRAICNQLVLRKR